MIGMILAVPIGLVLQKMYEAGFFETTIDSIRILLVGFNRFRKLGPEDLPDGEDEIQEQPGVREKPKERNGG